MSRSDKFPPISEQFIKAMEDKYPDKMPSHHDSHIDIAFAAGQVAVVRNLRSMYDQQNKNLIKAN